MSNSLDFSFKGWLNSSGQNQSSGGGLKTSVQVDQDILNSYNSMDSMRKDIIGCMKKLENKPIEASDKKAMNKNLVDAYDNIGRACIFLTPFVKGFR